MGKDFIKIILFVILASGFGLWYSYTQYIEYEGNNINSTKSLEDSGLVKDVELTIIFDNNPYEPGLQTAWGFACFIDLVETKILFDTGGNPRILLANMEKMGIDVDEIQIIALSHIHGDHVGGLFAILERNSCIEVFLPASFPADFKSKVEEYGCRLVEVKGPLRICEGVMSTGELGLGIKEQSLIIKSSKGIILVTGCAHPGIVNIVKRTVELTNERIHLVIGGFHLSGASKERIETIIRQFESLGVKKVASCHCSGNLARNMLNYYFGKNYIDSGVGRIIKI